MGTVYLAHDPTLDRPAAVKVIRAKALSDTGRERFLREARACSRINHPNVITVYAAGEENGEPYMAMELIEGRTLRDVMKDGDLDWRTATRWVVQLLDALQRLHADGIVHRDLKPENIMVTKDGVIKLMDFGLAHLTTLTALTEEGTTLGTVPYMSPEQVLGKRLDARSDLFSLATILHEMITGTHPFRGDHPMAVMYSIRNETPRPLKLQSGDFPVGLQAVLDRAFEKEVDKRYADAAAFRDAILTVVPDLGSAAVEARPSPRRLALLVGAVSTGVAALALVLWSAVGDRQSAGDRKAAANLNELGYSELQSGNVVQAEQYFRQAMDRDPSFALPYHNLGELALRQHEVAEADSMFRLAVQRNPHYTAPLVGVGNLFFDRAENAASFAGADADSAEAWYRRGLRGDEPALAANQLGNLLLRRGHPAEAKTVLAGALTPTPPNEAFLHGALLRNLGKAEAALGDSTVARQHWREALTLLPDNAELKQLTGTE